MRTKYFGWLMACVVLAAVPLMISTFSIAQAPPPRPAPIMPPGIPPTHVVDLMTTAGAAALGAQWKVSDVKIVEVPAIQGAMPQYKTTYSIEPQAGGSDFDDSKWSNIEPKDLAARRSGGHVAFMWYRTPLTIPAKIGDFDPSGAVTVDDYADVWVNGAIPGRSGYPSPATIQGHNMPNRVVLGTGVKAGDPDRGLRNQRTDFNGTGKYGVVPPGNDGILQVGDAQELMSGCGHMLLASRGPCARLARLIRRTQCRRATAATRRRSDQATPAP